MKSLSEVEAAKALMSEAVSWSVMKWLREKKRVRRAADDANAALDQLSLATKLRWTHELRTAYEALAHSAPLAAPARVQKTGSTPSNGKAVRALASNLKDSDDAARRARIEAEETFDKAEKRLSTSLAREGCRKAILAWDLHEKAIRNAEAAIPAE